MKGIAIDPGTQEIGYCLFDWTDNRLTFLDYGSYKTTSSRPIEFRLHQIFTFLSALLKDEEILVTENSFYNPKQPSGGAAVREALGVIKVVAVSNKMQVHLLRPMDAKWAVTGSMTASKLDVANGVAKLGIPLPLSPDVLIQKKKDHITDAISLAIAFVFTFVQSVTIHDKKGKLLCGHSKPVPNKQKTKKTSGKRKTTAKRTSKKTLDITKTTTKRTDKAAV